MEKFSADPFYVNTLNILQPKNGYRFSIDSIVLAAHVRAENKKTLIDIGTGCGIIPLMLALRYPNLDITGIEIQKELYEFACQNISENHLNKNIFLMNKDINGLKLSELSELADVIVSNPPYKKKGSGRLNPDSQKAIARHEIHLDINQLFKCSKRLLKEQGVLYLIFPADRLTDLQSAMFRYQFSTKFMRFVHTKKGLPPKRVVLCAINNDCQPFAIKPPLYIYSDKNQYTDEYLDLIQPHDKNYEKNITI